MRTVADRLVDDGERRKQRKRLISGRVAAKAQTGAESHATVAAKYNETEAALQYHFIQTA